jgi:predicted nucleic acid-binding protein
VTLPLRAIPDGAAVLVDANVIIYALVPASRSHAACADLLDRGARGALTLHLPVTAAADVLHQVMTRRW